MEESEMVEGWKNYCLKEIIDELIMGQSPDSSSYNNEEKGIAFIQGNADMQNGVPSIRMFTTDPKRYSELNDILLSVRAPVGDVFYNNYGNLSIGRGLSAIRIKNKHLRTLVYYWLKFDKKQFERLEQGTTFTEIGKKEVRNINVTIPTNSKEQASIANILSKVDEAIESVKKSIAAAEKLKKSLMQNLLTGRMKPDGTLRKDDEFYVDEKFGKVPIGWEVKKLGNLFHIKAGGDLQENFYSPIYDEQHKCPIFSNTIENSGLYGYTSNPRFISKESLTIVGRGVGVGHVEYRKGNYDAIIRLISLIPKQEDAINCMYVNYYICQYVHFAIESTGVPQLTCPKVFSTKIIIPKNVFEQSQIAEKIHCIDIDIKIKQNQIITLEHLKKSLMQNLLTGKVRVWGSGK